MKIKITLIALLVSFSTFVLAQNTCETAYEYGEINDPAISGLYVSGSPVWYSFTASRDFQNVSVSLCESSFDTKMEVWDSCDAVRYMYYDDNACGLQSFIFIDYLPAGTYFVKVYGSDENSFGDYKLEIKGEEVTASIDDLANKLDINVYPNPSDGKFTLELNSSYNDIFDIRITNAVGVLIEEETNIEINGRYLKNYDLSHLGSGIYMIMLHNDNERIVEKIIIQ